MLLRATPQLYPTPTPSPMPDTPFIADFRVLLEKHSITAPAFAYGGRTFNPAKPQCLYSGPVYDTEELVAATSALVEGKWSVAGEHVHRFEGMFSRYLGVSDSVMVNSGSSANLLLLAAAKAHWGWPDGSAVLVSPVGFPTTISALTLNNLRPVFVDIEWRTLNASNDEIARKIWDEYMMAMELGERSQVKAILVSPVLGNPPDIDQIVALAREYRLKILMDGCDSLGTTWRGKHLAQYADATTCSFFPSHHISCLQGGMISSNDPELISTARKMSAWGRDCHCVGAANLLPKGVCGKRFSCWLPSLPDTVVDHKYVYGTSSAYNLQPLDIQGALGCAQMGKLESIHAARRRAWHRLRAMFIDAQSVGGARTVERLYWADPSWFGFPIVCPDAEYKRALVAHLEAAGVQTRNYFAGNILVHPGYQHLGKAADYPNAQQVLQKVFFLGCNPTWTDDHFNHIEQAVRSFCKL
jgi:CDP-6-deoxy-D-xylo-4-hexulose-3-dehydrase